MTDQISAISINAHRSSVGSFLPHRSNALAVGEGVLLLGALSALHYSGVLIFSAWPVHPFLFVVILLSAQYGIQGGILAAIGAIMLSHLDGWPARPFDMAYAEYFRLAWADGLSWMLAALAVGTVTTHRARVMQEQTIKLRQALRAENLIASQYQVLVQRTHDLERSLAVRADSSPSADSAPALTGGTRIPAQRSKTTPSYRVHK